MDISRTSSTRQTRISLAGECTIYHAAEMKPLLLDDDSGLDRDVLLNLESVSALDSAGVQILLMLRKQIANAGGRLKIIAGNDTVAQVFATLRLPSPFNPEEVIP